MAGWGATCRLLLLLLGTAVGLAAAGRRLICWQAMMQCQGETDCKYAYRQYTEACSSVLPRLGDNPSSAAFSRRRCPSHCISALILLNNTRRGPALEDCDCVMDEVCKATKRAIEPCLPRTSADSGGGGAAGGGGGAGSSAGGGAVMGCMEARRLCETDWRCSTALKRYLGHCGRLFNGVRCTEECKAVIEDMMLMPKALLLNDCVCDGLERAICESIKENMAHLCFGTDGALGSSGGADYEYDEDYEEETGVGRGSNEEEQGPSGVIGLQAMSLTGGLHGVRIQ
uniref:Growth arrest specific 1 n=1 Tax=Leptobrachium leishanense TaxID=445787 RepID=A0A8C5LW90_9ANUR